MGYKEELNKRLFELKEEEEVLKQQLENFKRHKIGNDYLCITDEIENSREDSGVVAIIPKDGEIVTFTGFTDKYDYDVGDKKIISHDSSIDVKVETLRLILSYLDDNKTGIHYPKNSSVCRFSNEFMYDEFLPYKYKK